MDIVERPLVWPDVPWSYSALNKFEACPLDYGSTNHKKLYPFVNSPQMEAGTVVHGQLENYVVSGKEVPLMLKRITNMIDKLAAKAEEVYPERGITLSYDLRPVSLFHDDARMRCKVDLTLIYPDNSAIIVDYKTSSEPREDFEQLDLCALATMIEKPRVKKVTGLYIYTKHDKRVNQTLTRADIPRLVHGWTPRLQRLKDMRDKANRLKPDQPLTDAYPATPGPQCRWCQVVTCRYNPKRGAM